MGYCINPECKHRENPETETSCQSCGTNLLIDGRYRLLKPLRPLGSRSYTEVFEAVDEQGTHKVLKILKSQEPKLIELLEREASVLLALRKVPGIPRVERSDYFTVKLSSGSLLRCLGIEKIEGQNLEQWLEAHGRLPQALALDWLTQLVEILDQVHQGGYFHRDIKPANIIVQPNGQLALVDFGAVRRVSETYLAKVSGAENTTGVSHFHDITIVRTAGYAPLEQINGKALPQSDFYALGCTFAHLMTGIALHQIPNDPNTNALLWRAKAPQIADPLADLVDWLMAPPPGKRPQNTKVLLQHLKDRLPQQLKIFQIRQSLPFRVGMILLGVLAVVGVCKAYNSAAYYYYFVIGLETQRSGFPGSAQEAQAYFQNALAFDPDSVTTYINLGRAYQDQGKDECALDAYQRAIALDPTNAAAYYNLGDFYDSRNQFDKAEAAFTKAAQFGENQTGAVSNALARIKNRRQDYKAALPLAQQGVDLAIHPQDQAVALKNLGWAKFGLAETQQRQGQLQQTQTSYQEAEQHLKASIQQDPTRPAAYCLLAQVQEARGAQASAHDNWRQCLQRNDFVDLPEVSQWRQEVLNRLYDGQSRPLKL